jgi:hypothetical protein
MPNISNSSLTLKLVLDSLKDCSTWWLREGDCDEEFYPPTRGYAEKVVCH